MSFCDLKQRPDGKWYCTKCSGPPLKGDYKRPTCKVNGRPPKPVHVDAAKWFTAYHAKPAVKRSSPPLADMLAKLERCRSADCSYLQDDVCVKPPNADSCRQRQAWFYRLSRGVCTNWKPIAAVDA